MHNKRFVESNKDENVLNVIRIQYNHFKNIKAKDEDFFGCMDWVCL